MKSKRSWIATNKLKTKQTFSSIFPRDEKTVDSIAKHMAANSYDASLMLISTLKRVHQNYEEV
jgi:hypothetical protein